MKIVSFSLEQGSKYFGKIDGDRFFIGTRVSFQGLKGLMNTTGTPAQKYDRSAFREAHGFWADFLHPTSMAEGALFHTLNTYDRARFTFTFLQYAAHVPNGDFVKYFRALLQLPLAAEYFPELRVQSGRIVRVTDEGTSALETDQSTAALMDYLNPTSQQIEDTEVIQAAKFIHWAQTDPLHRQVQVDLAVAHFRERMREYAQRYTLDGKPDRVCLVVADIRHQGRAKSAEILAALQTNDPLKSLLGVGQQQYPERVATLKREIDKLTTEGVFGVRKYSVGEGNFVNA